jgi:hypothetical protein
MERQIATIINNGMNTLGRKIDSLTMELRQSGNRKSPMSSKTDFNLNLPDNVGESISKAIKDGFSKMEIPEPKFTFPESKAPVVNVPAPIVNIPALKFPKIPAPVVNIPETQITVTPTPVTFPSEMRVLDMDRLIAGVNREVEKNSIFEEVSSKRPLPMIILDSNGKQINDFGGNLTAPSIVGIRVGTTAINEDNPMPVTVDGFAIPIFDTQVIDESLAPATTVITYKRNGVTVATKTITVAGTTTTITVT